MVKLINMDIFKPLEMKIREYEKKHPRERVETKNGVRYFCMCNKCKNYEQSKSI